MTEEPESPGASGSGETDLPIQALSELEQNISPTFLDRVRNKIYRRTTASQFASFSWTMPAKVFVEFVSVLAHLFSVMGGRGARRR